MSDLNELKQLAEAATPGPWGYDGSYVCPARVEDGTTYVESWRSVADCSQAENTKFIAAANPAAILALIAENERLSGECEGCPMEIAEALRIERDQLKAENEALRKAANELRRFLTCEDVHHDKPDWHEYGEPCKVLDRIDAVLGLGDKAGD